MPNPTDIISIRCQAYWMNSDGEDRMDLPTKHDATGNGCYAPLGWKCRIHDEEKK